LPSALRSVLARDGVRLAPYTDAARTLAGLPTESTLLIEPEARDLRPARHVKTRVVEAINPSTLFKSRKTAAEAASRARRDGAGTAPAMCAF